MLLDVVTDTDRFRELHNHWAQLLSSYDRVPLPLTHEWLFSWWQVFGRKQSLHIVTVYKEEELIAIAPFIVEKYPLYGVSFTRQKLMANDHSPFCNIILDTKCTEEEKCEVMRAIIQESTADLLSIFKVPQESLIAEYINSQPPQGRIVGITPSIITPVIKITEDWELFLKSKSRKFRKSLNNKLNKYSMEVDFTIKHEQIHSRQTACLNEIVAISKMSWKRNIGRDLGSNLAGREFLWTLADELGRLGKISVWIMYKAQVPIAYEYHVEFDNVIYPISADFSEDYRAYSPGSVLEYTALQSMFEGGRIQEYYSCANDYWYLNNWSKYLKHHITINLFAITLKGRILYFWEYIVKPILRPINDKYFRQRIKKR